MVDAHSSLGWLLATARLVCDYEKKGKWQTANNNNTEMMWNVLEQCTEWQRMNCLIAFLVCDISWGHNYCVQMILWRHTHTHSRSEANWNNKWINYLHLVRSSMECVNEKSTQLAACGIYVICTDSVRHNDNNVDGMDLRIRCSDVRCTPHRIQFVVLIMVCVHLFHRLRLRLRLPLNEWHNLCEFSDSSNDAIAICERTQLRVLILWLFTFPPSQPSRNEINTCSWRTEQFLWSARDEMEWEPFLFYFVFPVENVDAWRWKSMVAPHFWVDNTAHKNQK